MNRMSWDELSPARKVATVVLGSVELALTATAAVDLLRRPAERIRGPKALWWPAIFVQPVGPVAYLAWGRQR